MGGVHVVPAQVEDQTALEDFLRGWHSLRVARRGELIDASAQSAVLARSDSEVVGVATLPRLRGHHHWLALYP